MTMVKMMNRMKMMRVGGRDGVRDGPTRSLSQGLTLAGRWPLRCLIAPRNKVSHDAACPAPHDFKHDQTSMAYVYT